MRAAIATAVLALSACGSSHPAPKPPVTPVPSAASGSASGSGSGSGSSAPVAVIWDQLHGNIASFQIIGGEDIDYLRLQPVFNDEVGKPIDRVRLREKLERAMNGQTLFDIELTGEQLADGIKLIAHVVPQPKVVSIAMHDGHDQPVTTPPRLAEMAGSRLDPGDLDRLVEALRNEYAGEGNGGYAASWRADTVPGGVAVTVVATPGEHLTVSALLFPGAKAVKPADLEKSLAKDLAVGASWNPDVVERAALLVSAYYWDHGYAEVKVSLAAQPEHNPAPVTFQITEGDIFHLSTVVVTGVSPAEAKRYLAMMPKVKPGVLFGRTIIADAREAITADLVKLGHPKANVLPLTKVDVTKHTIAMTFDIDPDPK